ncbi:Hypothetical protein A7A1_0836 [Bacillus subtilis subsp. subtilis str. BSP1]|nr:Hypothetical protein A7A1_0836 [Bacillus subtilis subsp. subtilis str. BSP1]
MRIYQTKSCTSQQKLYRLLIRATLHINTPSLCPTFLQLFMINVGFYYEKRSSI